MKASRSLGSTTAPHLIILSTSLVHAFLLRRCCKMMRASWHSVHAVWTFDCMEPDGRPPDRPDSGSVHANAITAAKIAAQNAPNTRNSLCLNMDLHLVNDVVEISTRIPRRSLRLGPAMAVSGSRQNRVLPGTRSTPGIIPQTPCVLRLLSAELRRLPCRTAVGRDFDASDIGLPCPGCAVNVNRA